MGRLMVLSFIEKKTGVRQKELPDTSKCELDLEGAGSGQEAKALRGSPAPLISLYECISHFLQWPPIASVSVKLLKEEQMSQMPGHRDHVHMSHLATALSSYLT